MFRYVPLLMFDLHVYGSDIHIVSYIVWYRPKLVILIRFYGYEIN